VVLREQKKTATEIMAMICAGDFSHSLQVIANQVETTNKIKEHFPNLVALVEIKTGLIEPIFAALATHNAAMGDWLIREFIRRNLFTHSALVGKLVLCDRARLIDRLRIMLDKTVVTLATAAENQGVFTQTLLSFIPFVKVFIKTLHIAAPALRNPVDLEVGQDTFMSLTTLICSEAKGTIEKDAHKYLGILNMTLLVPPAPFVNSKLDLFTFTTDVLMKP